MTQPLHADTRAAELPELLAAGWQQVPNADALRKVWQFSSFSQAWAFMTRTALLAEKMNHHPEWSNVYGLVDITLTTHDAGGLSALDLRMAKSLDRMSGSAQVVPDHTNLPPTQCQIRAAQKAAN